MEDDEIAAPHRVENIINLFGQLGQLFARGGGIGEIGPGIIRIHNRELRGNCVQPKAGILRGEPGMRVMRAMRMALMACMVFMIVVIAMVMIMRILCGMIFMPVIIMIAMVVMRVVMIVVVMVMRLGLCLFMAMTLVIPMVMAGMVVVMLVMRMILGFGFLMPVIVVIVVILCSMIFMVMIIMIVMIAMVVIMCFKQRAFAEIEQGDVIHLQQLGDGCALCQGLDRVFKLRRQIMPDPENKLRLLQGRRGGGAHAEPVRAIARGNDQIGAANPLHHPRHERMNRRDINSYIRHIRQCRSPQERR